MRRMFQVCAGIDVGKTVIFVCLIKALPDGRIETEIRRFETTTRVLLTLADWLVSEGCQSVAMESTGVYWKPVFNVLEASMPVVLANAQHIKNLPGRKTDVKDCEWIAELHLHGLVKASFIPPPEIRVLRDLVRTRTKLIGERAQHVNRIQKVLEDANIKLGSVASDVLGVSGRLMLDRLVAGETDPKVLASLARGRMRPKQTALQEALEGRIRAHHRLLLKTHLGLVDSLDAAIDTLTEEIEEQIRPFAEIRDRLDAMPGIGADVATIYISEMGVDTEPWPTYQHAASWAGLSPGNHESAGKRKGGRPHHGNRWLKQAFTQAAWSAGRAKGTYMESHFRRVRSRRGAKKAAGAVAHSLFVRCVLMVERGTPYHELGPAHFDERSKDAQVKRLVRQIEKLGFDVKLESHAA